MRLIKKIIEYLKYQKFFFANLKATENKILYAVKSDSLKTCSLSSNKQGVSSSKYFDYDIIVSLTTYGKRLYEVSTTIESIMQGTLLPNKIVLNISSDYLGQELPFLLKRQVERGLEINYCKDIRSYTKLIPTLRKYPDSAIITIDDDLIYGIDFLENLVNTHKANPNFVCANRIHEIVLGENGIPLPYRKWNWCANPQGPSPLNFLTGVGGVLYPPKCFDREVFNEDVFLDICKFADDIWFFAMLLKNDIYTIKSFTHNKYGEDYIINDVAQEVALGKLNNHGNNLNNIQFKAVFEKYNLFEKLMRNG